MPQAKDISTASAADTRLDADRRVFIALAAASAASLAAFSDAAATDTDDKWEAARRRLRGLYDAHREAYAAWRDVRDPWEAQNRPALSELRDACEAGLITHKQWTERSDVIYATLGEPAQAASYARWNQASQALRDAAEPVLAYVPETLDQAGIQAAAALLYEYEFEIDCTVKMAVVAVRLAAAAGFPELADDFASPPSSDS
jgi:hypothetical protein